MKNLFSMLLDLAMAVSLAACGAGASGIPQESQSGSSSSAPTEDIPAPDTGDGAADGPAQSSPEDDHYGYEIPAGELPPGY